MKHVLIALNGNKVKATVLNAAFALCDQLNCRIDILILQVREEIPEALARFLQRLQRASLNYRLVRADGQMSLAVMDYARKYTDVDLILIDTLKSWGTGIPLQSLKRPFAVLASIAAA